MNYQPEYKYIPPFEYHFLTRIYDYILILAGFGRKFREKIVNAVEVKNGQKALDVGCGTGVFLHLLKQKYPGVFAVGIDPDQEALDISAKKFGPDVKLIKSFAEALPFENESFDIVFSTLAFHHMPTEIKEQAIQEIYRVLKPGGKLVIIDFGTAKHHWFYRIVTFWESFEYMRGNLQGLLPQFMQEAGFKNVKEDSIKFPVIHLLVGNK